MGIDPTGPRPLSLSCALCIDCVAWAALALQVLAEGYIGATQPRLLRAHTNCTSRLSALGFLPQCT